MYDNKKQDKKSFLIYDTSITSITFDQKSSIINDFILTSNDTNNLEKLQKTLNK